MVEREGKLLEGGELEKRVGHVHFLGHIDQIESFERVRGVEQKNVG